jgi:hypothetical protein
LQAEKEAAAKALVPDAGCLRDRARALVDAFAEVVAQEALAIIAGIAEVATGVVDGPVEQSLATRSTAESSRRSAHVRLATARTRALRCFPV